MGRNDVRVDVRHSIVQIHTATATVRPVAAVATRKGVLDVCHSPSFIRMGRNDAYGGVRYNIIKIHTAITTARTMTAVATRKGVTTLCHLPLCYKNGTQRYSSRRPTQHRPNAHSHSRSANRGRGCHSKIRHGFMPFTLILF